MDKKAYALKDGGGETYDVCMMDADELQQAQEHADAATDGTFGWVELDVTYGSNASKKLLKDLHDALFNITKQPYRIPCDCPPAEPVYDHRGKVIGANPHFSCVYCRLNIAVDRIYEQEEAHRQEAIDLSPDKEWGWNDDIAVANELRDLDVN